MTSRLRIQVDQAAGQGSGVCTGIASQYFQLGQDALSRPVHEVVDADGAESVLDAAECCPLEAITVTDADTGQPVV